MDQILSLIGVVIAELCETKVKIAQSITNAGVDFMLVIKCIETTGQVQYYPTARGKALDLRIPTNQAI